MVIDRAERVFIYVVLAVAMLMAALEVTAARGSGSAPKADPRSAEMPWTSPLLTMDAAIARGDLMSAERARHEAYRAALASRRWEGYLAAGDAILRVGDATQGRSKAEPEALRLYLSALFRARGEQSLDGVLLATEAFARLGDREVADKGLHIARDLAGREPEAQARVRVLEDRLSRHATAGSADGAPLSVVR